MHLYSVEDVVYSQADRLVSGIKSLNDTQIKYLRKSNKIRLA